MAILINEDEIKKNEEAKGGTTEEFHVPSGYHVVNFVSYVDLGKHQKNFMGKPAVFEKGKNKGQMKQPELFVSCTFEFSGCEHSSEYPLCYETSIFMKDGGFINALSVSDDFANNLMSLQFANKVGYKKLLDAINLHCGKKFQGLHQAVGTAIHVQAKTTAHGKIDGKDVKLLDTEVPGYDPENPAKNIEGFKYYTSFKPESIQPMKVVMGKAVIDMSEYIVPFVGEYTPVFDWDAPTKDGWDKLKPWQKRAISRALNLRESPLGNMAKVDEELAKELEGYRTNSTTTDTEAQTSQAPDVPPPMADPDANVSTTEPEDDLPI